MRAGGVSAKSSLLRISLEPLPNLTFCFDSDACHGDEDDPTGIGGHSHGIYWYFRVPHEDYVWVHTPGLEFLGVCFSILVAA